MRDFVKPTRYTVRYILSGKVIGLIIARMADDSARLPAARSFPLIALPKMGMDVHFDFAGVAGALKDTAPDLPLRNGPPRL